MRQGIVGITRVTVAMAVVLTAAAPLRAQAGKYHWTVEKLYAGEDPFIRDTVLPNIEKHRKSRARFVFRDDKGAPLIGAAVSFRHVNHNYLFGCVPPEKGIWDFEPGFIKAWKDLWNYGMHTSQGKWDHLNNVEGVMRYSYFDMLLDTAMDESKKVELHFLTGYHPDWLANHPDSAKAVLQKAHAKKVLDRYQDRIDFFQVYNEDWLTQVPRGKVYFDQTAFFRELRREYPKVKLGVSDCWTLGGSLGRWLPSPDSLAKRYPGIDYIALHGHQSRMIWTAPRDVYRNYAKYLDSKIKIHVTEFGLIPGEIEGGYRTGVWNETNKAEYFVQIQAVHFSHPSVEAFNHWSMAPEIINRFKVNSLLNTDLTPKDAYLGLKSLIKDKFSTRVEARTGADGAIEFSGFHGEYEVILKQADGRQAQINVNLLPDSADFAILKALRNGNPVLFRDGSRPVSLDPARGLYRLNALPAPMRANPGPEGIRFTGLGGHRVMYFHNAAGRLVRRIPIADGAAFWDGKDANGEPVRPSALVLRLR